MKPSIDSRMLLVHDGLFILANDVAFVILFDPVPGLNLASLWIINRFDLLRRPVLPPVLMPAGRRWHQSRCF